MKVKRLFILGLDISDDDVASEEDLLEAAFRRVLKDIGINPGPYFPENAHVYRLRLRYDQARPLALALVETSKREEVLVLMSQRLHMVVKGQLSRGTWDAHPYYKGEHFRRADRFSFITDELLELYEMKERSRQDGAAIEEIDHGRALRLWRATHPRRRAELAHVRVGVDESGE